MRYLLLALVLTACGRSSPSAPGDSLTPATLVGTYQLRSYDGQATPSKTYGVGSGTITLRSDSTYTITINAIPAQTTPAGWDWNFIAGKWSYMGHFFQEDVVLLRPSFNGAPSWNGAIQNGGIAFSGNGYPDVFFSR